MSFMRKLLKQKSLVAGVLIALSLSGCGTSKFERTVTGAGLGAGVGAGIGAATGDSMASGAAVGALIGGLLGLATEKKDLNLDD